MAKDNNKSNSDLIQRLKTLLAESDQRPSNLQEEANQANREPTEEAIRDILKDEDDAQQNAPSEETNQEILEEVTQDISISESEIRQNEPTEEVNQDIQEETTQDLPSPSEEIIQESREEVIQDFTGSRSEVQQNKPTEEVNQDIREETTQDLPSPSEEIIQESREEVTQDFTGSRSEVRQEEPPEEVNQERLGKDVGSDQLKNNLREGVNMPQVGNYVVNYKNIIIKTSDGSVISGKTNIDAFGRLTEYLKQGTDKFITVFSEEEGDKSKQVTIVNKDHIIWANTWD